MILAFVESIAIVGLLGIFVVCGSVIACALYRLISNRKLTRTWLLATVAAFLPFFAFMALSIITGDIEYNPTIATKEELIGVYTKGEYSITLSSDGSYTAKGFGGKLSGAWINLDWNLTLSDSPLERPRIVTRNGIFCIAPFYSGADETIGILLEKQSEQASPANHRPFGTSGMAPADSAPRAGATPEASGDS